MTKLLRQTLMASAVASLMTVSYFVGAAHSANTQAVLKLDQSVDMLVKARAILGSIATRQGVGNIDKAKANIDGALNEIAAAKTANGG